MPEETSIHQKLIDAENCCLVIIDFQRPFLDKFPEEYSEQLVTRLLWLVNVAKRLDIPLVVMAEDMEENGSIIPELEAILPSDTHIKNKMIFALASRFLKSVFVCYRGERLIGYPAGRGWKICRYDPLGFV